MLALLSGLFAALFSNGVAYFLAVKVVLTTLFIVIMPIILNNFFKSIMDGMLSLISGYTGTVAPVTAEFTGFMGWMCVQLQIPGVFAVIFSAIALKATLRMIPFVRL